MVRKRPIRIKPKADFFTKMGISNININEIVVDERNHEITIDCVVNAPSSISELDKLEEVIHKNFGTSTDCSFKVDFLDKKINKEELRDVIERIIREIKKKNVISRTFLYIYRIHIHEGYIDIELKNEVAIDALVNSKVDMMLESSLLRYGIDNLTLRLKVGDFTKELEEVDNQLIEISKELAEKADEEVSKLKETSKERESKKVEEQDKEIIHGRKIKGTTVTFEDFEQMYDGENCVLEGEVFSVEKRDLRNEKQLITFAITNYKNSISCKIFVDKNKGKNINIELDKWVKVGGKKQRDQYANDEEIIMTSSINRVYGKDRKVREDNAPEKRIELHSHTKMSEMVGTIDAKDLVARAAHYGHKSIAITDYGVVHSFPFAYKGAKGKDIKVIFGCESYMVDDTRPMVINGKDIPILEETYIVYDLETMGLDSHNGEIIEIGAVKMKGTHLIDTFSALVNPYKPIPQKIQDLTGITDKDVEGQPGIERVLPEFLKFIDDGTLVAHNAKFDIGFLKRDVKKILGKTFDPPLIDTLHWARDLMPELRGYGLKSITKKLGVALENHHRAVDDSQATAKMFGIFLEMFDKKGGKTLDKLDGIFPINGQKRGTNNVMILVKNKAGLQNLYNLVSKGHMETYGGKKPRIFKSDIEKHREGLLIGAPSTMYFGNEGELISDYLTYNQDLLKEKIKFYDYVELQPKATYNELVEVGGTGKLPSVDAIQGINSYLYNLGKENNKLVIATSNVHYLDERDYIARSILLYGSGSVFRKNQYMIDNKLYFRTTEEMLDEFYYLGDEIAREIVIDGPNTIDDLVEKINPIPEGFYPPKIDNAEEIVRDMTYEKAYRIYGNPLPEVVSQRLERELEAIIGNGFSVLYLSAQKLVKKSLDNGYLVGSRGSVGSSLVAYMMDITEVNALYPHYICEEDGCYHTEFLDREGAGVDLPDKDCPKCNKKMKKEGHAIPFEVFMGFNGDKVPDIDLNFSGEYQSEIHRYCEELFGKENVFKAGTISTLAEKNAFGYVKKFFEEHELPGRSAEISRLAKKVEGAKKTTGQHPGGMIVVPQGHSIYEFTPVQRPANDVKNPSTTTHFDYHVMDEQLVKLDILGHDDPTTIKILQEYTGIDIYDVPLGDRKTLDIFSGTEALGVSSEDIGSIVGTYGVPEFGTSFVRQMLVDTKPTTFAELVRISGLSHGTDVWLNNAQEFVRQGKATLSEVISVRDDIMNYLIDSGIEKGTAFKIMEFVRKGRPSKEIEQWEDYSNLMKEHKVADWYIESCKRIKYMFPKGHAVAYVMMAMRIAYFKVHHPLAFYGAYLSRKAFDFDSDFMLNLTTVKEKISELNKENKLDVRQKGQMALSEVILEMYARGYEFLGVDVYKSDGFRFVPEDGKVRVPLIAINGLGESVVENILKERKAGTFLSYEDLKRRTKASQTIVEKLKEVNAIEGLSDTNQRSLF